MSPDRPTSPPPRGCVALLCAVGVALSPPSTGAAQTSLTVSGGPAEFDLSGTGWSGTVAVHVERSTLPWLRVEAGSGGFWYRAQGGERIVMLLPEVGVVFQAPRAFPIHLGLGAGHTLTVRGSQRDDLTVYGALGLSFAPTDAWQIRPEMRVRAVDPFHGVIAGYTIGVRRRIGG